MLVLAQAAASLIAPGLAVAGAVAVAVPITLHLLSRRRRRQRPWAAMRFLREAIEKQRRRLRFERWLLLACRCLALVLLGLALAGPLLGGSLAAGFGVGGATGRSVELLIDNGLTATTPARSSAGGATPGGPLEELGRAKRRAAELLGGLDPADRVRVWPLAGGVDTAAPAEPETLTPAQAADVVAGLSATDAGAEWEATLTRASAAAAAAHDAGREAALVVLSPLHAGDGVLTNGRGRSSSLPEREDGPRVHLARPAPGRSNLQVASVRPGRAVLTMPTDAGPAAARSRRGPPLEAVALVRRAGVDATVGAAPVEARLRVRVVQPADASAQPPPLADPPRTTATAARTWSPAELATWPAVAEGVAEVSLARGAAEATVRVRLQPLARALPRRGEALLVASLDEGAGGAVAADDVALARLRLVDAVNVRLVGGTDPAGGLGPADFWFAALGSSSAAEGPADGPAGPFAVEALPSLLEPIPEEADALVVLDPAAVGPAGREALAAFVEAGGTLWVTPSAEAPADDPGAGLDPLFAALGLPWRIAAETPLAEGTPARADAARRAPAPLSLLAGQWEALLRPLRFDRTVGLAGVDPADVWMATEASGADPEGRSERLDRAARPAGVLLASASAGPVGVASDRGSAAEIGSGGAEAPATPGRVVFLAAAVDAGWTNLQAKPLFPALVRDGLLAAMSQPLDRPAEVASANAGHPRALVDASVAPVRLVAPAVDAADTSAVTADRAAAFFASVGEVSFLPETGLESALGGQDARASLAGALLWSVLILLVFEALAGRAFTRT